MRIRPVALSAVFAAGMAALPLTANAQYYSSPMCNPFPLSWPFCIIGAIDYAVMTPFRAAPPQPYYYGYGGGPPYYAPPPPPYTPPPAAPAPGYGAPPPH